MNKIKTIILNKINTFKKIKKVSIFTHLPNFNIYKKIPKINIFAKFEGLHLFPKIAKISTFNKLVILFIFLLFTFLFYLSIPALYDSNKLQNQLKKNLKEEFNLNIDLSSDITYKILPSPHFEILQSPFYVNSKTTPIKLGEIKSLNTYISISNLFSQDKIKVKKIKINDSIFNFNKNNVNYIKDYFKKKISKKEFIIKKSKVFFDENENSIFIILINNFIASYNEKNAASSADMEGLIFNSFFKLKYQNEFPIKKSSIDIKFKELNLNIKNEIKKNEEKNYYDILNSINFIGSNINTEIKLIDNSLKFSSLNSILFKEKFVYTGNVNLNPFYFNSNFELGKIKFKDLINFIFNKSLLKNEFLFHENLNGKIILNIKELQNGQIFDNCSINLEFINGSIKLDNSLFNIFQVGTLKVVNGDLVTSDKGNILRSSILISIKNEKKFYQLFQIPKNSRKSLKSILFEFEQNLNTNSFEIKNIKVNSKNKENFLTNVNFLIENFLSDNSSKDKNWIEIKNFLKKIIIEINLV